MKNFIQIVSLIGIVLSLLFVSGTGYAEHNEDSHSENMQLEGRAQFEYGTDLAFQGNLMVAGSGAWDENADEYSGVYLYNISNPVKPKLISKLPCQAWHSDVGIWGNYVVQSHDSGSDNKGCSPGEGKEGIRIIDITNRNQPESVGFAETIHGSHNLSVVGDTGFVYVSSYNLVDSIAVDGVSIVDIRDPKNPKVKFLEFPDVDNTALHDDMHNESGMLPISPGCHDIGIDMEKNLAFCGGIDETHIWDISDPWNPVIVSIIRNPAINIHHGADNDNTDGDVLIIDDEFAGAAGGPAACTVEGAPTGALWFYDISDPKNPEYMSYWSPPTTDVNADFCTSHFYGSFPDRNWVAGSWYEEGVRVVDFSDPYNPKEVAYYDPEGANFWSAYPYNGYIFANSFAPAGSDQPDKGGLYIFSIDGYTKSDYLNSN
ncbi:LVIVD repeat-containing protein [Alkalihalobacillus sp. AL-G]|uniref:LVIVD repeat-containing protein n=1 Tax=Alkalihalobacillus sp. AL-G TaxID=2926399 RepID=UPI00272B0D7C|nr:hypothetical protein [Alkalihalobacillus sp. AL-G]WLD94578.1 hypothetical protein MOJ78_06755 [Alkalihalobacillus sp. AL-G]